MSSINFATLLESVKYIINCENPQPVLIRGPHGIGKSELVQQIAKMFPLEDGAVRRVFDRRASQMPDAGDIIGLPVLSEDMTSWNPPDWYKYAMNHPCIVFLDEVDRATLEVRQALFQLGDSRSLNGHKLHPKTLLFAATNGGMHSQSTNYQVGSLDPAELDRWTVFDVEPTVDEWLNWAKAQNIHFMILEFIATNPAHLEYRGAFQPNKKYPSRRSWVRAAFSFDCMISEFGSWEKIPPALVCNVFQGFLGIEAAFDFTTYLEKHDRLVPLEDVFFDGKFELIEKFSARDYIDFAERFNISNIPDDFLDESALKNIALFFDKLPVESAVKLFTTMIRQFETLPEDASEELIRKTNFPRWINLPTSSGETVRKYFESFFTDPDCDMTEVINKVSEPEPEVKNDEE